MPDWTISRSRFIIFLDNISDMGVASSVVRLGMLRFYITTIVLAHADDQEHNKQQGVSTIHPPRESVR